ncbi:hypothetical protein EV122DRAFT_256397 [Schizophyllum commune]
MDPSLVEAFLATLPTQEARTGFTHIIERITASANQAQEAAAAAEQRVAHAEQRAAAAEQTLSTMSDLHQQSIAQLQSAVESAIGNAHAAPSTPRNNALRVVMARFDGDTANGNSASNWISTCEDHLRAYSVDASIWVVTASLLFDKSARTWYKDYKDQHPNGLPDWETFRSNFIARFQPAIRLDDIRRRLLALTYHGNINSYNEQFQRLESQVPADQQTFGDRFFSYCLGLPSALALFLRDPKSPVKTMSEAYERALAWEQTTHLTNARQPLGSQTSRPLAQLPKWKPRRDTPHPAGRFPASSTTPSYATTSSSSSNEPAPMDLDTMNNAGPSSSNTNSSSRGPRCFNCGRFGHFSRDCRAPPRRRPQPPPSSSSSSSSARPARRTQQMFTMATDLPPFSEELRDEDNLPGIHNGSPPPQDMDVDEDVVMSDDTDDSMPSLQSTSDTESDAESEDIDELDSEDITSEDEMDVDEDYVLVDSSGIEEETDVGEASEQDEGVAEDGDLELLYQYVILGRGIEDDPIELFTMADNHPALQSHRPPVFDMRVSKNKAALAALLKTLMDTGAGACYISRAVAERLGLTIFCIPRRCQKWCLGGESASKQSHDLNSRN